jgi:hypothetical protein
LAKCLDCGIDWAPFEACSFEFHFAKLAFEEPKAAIFGGAHFRYVGFWRSIQPAKLDQQFLEVFCKTACS